MDKMNIKIQGGGDGKYENSGSSRNIAEYVCHEDNDRLAAGLFKECFFNLNRDNVSKRDVIDAIDNNKRKLSNKDAKFFVITVSPSEREILEMGESEIERSLAFKDYIRKVIIPLYAENFRKDLTADDIMFFTKIHHNRLDTAGMYKSGEQMHAHIIVSRKDMQNNKKLSPLTNHKSTDKGMVTGGFNRSEFFNNCEKLFDRMFGFSRDISDSFGYYNSIKHAPWRIKYQIAKGALRQLNTGRGAIGITPDKILASITSKYNELAISKARELGLSAEQIIILLADGSLQTTGKNDFERGDVLTFTVIQEKKGEQCSVKLDYHDASFDLIRDNITVAMHKMIAMLLFSIEPSYVQGSSNEKAYKKRKKRMQLTIKN